MEKMPFVMGIKQYHLEKINITYFGQYISMW